MTSQPTNPTILLLKTKNNPEDKYATLFSSKNFTPQFIPVLEHHLHSDALCSVRDLFASGGLLPGPGRRYGGLIFTSQRAVEGFAGVLGRIADLILHTSSTNLPIYTVGPATSSSLTHIKDTRLPNTEILGGDCGNGDHLASFILRHYNSLPPSITHTHDDAQSEGRTRKLPLLFLTGEQHRDAIPKTLMSESLPEGERIGVEEKIVYGTGIMEEFEEEFMETLSGLLAQDLDQGGEEGRRNMVWVTVFSPAGCESMLSVLKQLQVWDGGAQGLGATGKKRVYIATIGPTTRDHLRKFGFDADVCAEKPSPEGLWNGISRVMDGL